MTNIDSTDTHLHELASGIHVREIVAATAPEHVSGLLEHASVSGLGVVPFGGGRSLATGNQVDAAQFGLDLTGLCGVIAYEPADLTVSVRAGTTIAELQAELGASGQELPIDVPCPDLTTVGGLVATGFAGPRRLRSGTLRDLLIGCSFVRGDGLAAKAGGMVVKNVSGFEIPRFLHGSWGALAVLTSVNLKVAPRPRADGTVIASFLSMMEAAVACHALIAAEPAIESCVAVRRGLDVSLAARAVGRAAAVKETLASISRSLGVAADQADGDKSVGCWQDLIDGFAEGPERLLLAMNTRPRDISGLAKAVDSLVGNVPGVELMVSPGLGTMRVTMPVPEIDAGVLIQHLTSLATDQGASYVLESAPPALRSIVPPWGTAPDGLDLMRSVKREFDPAGILNPGRLFA